ncbi:glycoside hydrolase family 2 protein [Vallitalea pronyensis]|uniref:Glycoside hydrolase family 2 protein n=1 Tax=Vallitalea pronyensis TaxID=1348613 RepID=A0A8J8SIN2_9FIRM|nr:glycoside hydrolase family 2 TIM barrel-domain containing protein [Vallitalea pronyensis]QUI24688.1 glycoside hydrolase family 2 protein [Vallitalea pronyensis]
MREKLSLDKGWKFYKGDPAPPPLNGHQAVYMASKTERGRGLAAKDYYDADWEDVNVPHDYVILGDYDKTLQGSQGYLKRENAWYRRSFTISEEDKDKRLTLIFDGVATHATVWVNGHLLERNFCGYNSFEMDITDVIRMNETNVIAVRVETSELEGWWYEGAGIYRHVWMVKTNKTAVANWGTFVNPTKMGDTWQVAISTEISNSNFSNKKLTILHELKDQEGKCIASIDDHIETHHRDRISHSINIQDIQPRLWDINDPYLYQVTTSLKYDHTIVDVYETTFGFRALKFDADTGFYLNDINTKIKGVCGHFDHGGLGVAVPDQVWELRIKKLKAMGCNAYRCGHTPPAPEFLDLCDKYGLLVMDESRWFETSRIGLLQVENMLRRDRNHPSVFMWSVGNEEPLQSTDTGEKLAVHLKRFVRTLDTSRPVTVALNGGFYDSKVSKASDVVGVNYNYGCYDKLHELLPDHPICSPEVGATSNTRSVYVNAPENGHYLAYDDIHAKFGSTHRKAWEEVVNRDFVFGVFVWTGFEYRGESTWPKLFAGGGALDSSGFEKDNYHLFKALWTEEPMVHVMPHWNLDIEEGTEVKVMTYTNCEEVELFLNGNSLGRKENHPIHQTEWTVPYKEGTLRAVAYHKNKEAAVDIKETLKAPYHVEVNETPTGGKSLEQDVKVLEVSIRDKEGRLATHLDEQMTFELEGMTLLGTGNGDPADHDHNRTTDRKLFKGLCQVITRMNEQVENCRITVKTPNYGEASLVLDTKNVTTYPVLPIAKREWTISQWWRSPVKAHGIDLNKPINIHDVNTWEPITLGHQVFEKGKGYRHYYVSTKMPSFNDALNMACIKLVGIQGPVQFKIEHNKDYWPLPQPQAFLAIEEAFKEDTKEHLIPLKGFYKNEAVLLHIVVENQLNHIVGLKSVQWVIIKK